METFSLLIRRALPGQGENRTTLELVGYGSNGEMGQFVLQGKIELIGQNKLKERQMASPQLKRLKIAYFSLEKAYVYKELRQLAVEKARSRPQKPIPITT